MKLKSIFFGIAATMSLNVNASTIYTSTFTDNGNKVTEVRTFADSSVQTWEWLDLTVSNGISYNSLIADLADDGKLNNSSALNANAGALADVAGLSSDDQSGWQTQSDLDVVDLFNNFFGLSLVTGTLHYFNANVTIVEEFISMFGDTYHEGRLDNGSITGLNGSGKNSGFTFGSASTSYNSTYNDALYVFDGEYFDDLSDLYFDSIHTDDRAPTSNHYFQYGHWLSRERSVADVAAPVNTPSTIVLFALALMGIGVRRRLM